MPFESSTLSALSIEWAITAALLWTRADFLAVANQLVATSAVARSGSSTASSENT